MALYLGLILLKVYDTLWATLMSRAGNFRMSNSSMTASRTSPVRTPDALFPAAASSHRADGADVDICTDEGAVLRGPVAAEHAAVQPARAS